MEESERELENCKACGEVMDVTPFAPYSSVQCPSCGEQVHVKCQVGNYEILKRQGLGGMSLVFAACDTTLGRKVAIKLLNEHYSSDSKRVAEFEKEAKITASISHSNVVRVYTVGQAYDRYYIAMELVEGDSLEQLMHREDKLDDAVVTRLAIEVVEGLKAAHQSGLIHRDMKPGNILIDKKGRAKIVDFGLALMTSGGKAMAEEIWATPYYVSPETLTLKEEDLRSDIYALGASLYHALLGEPPFTTETKSTTELLKLKRTVPRLRSRTKAINPYLCEVIDKSMAFDAKDRYQTYEELLSALKQVEVCLRTGCTPKDLVEQKGRSQNREGGNRKWYVAGAAVVGASVVSAVMQLNGRDEESASVAAPVVERVVELEVKAKAEALRNLVAAELRNAQALLDQGQYEEAYQRYLKLVRTKGVESETVYWAGIRSAMSAWFAGDSQNARKALRITLKTQSSNERELSDVEHKLQQAINRLLSLYPIRVADMGNAEDSMDMMILFCSALKEWDQGQWKEAEVLFQSLQKVEIVSDAEDFEFYQEMARLYLDDFNSLVAFQNGFSPSTEEEAKQFQTQLLEARNALKTQGRALYNTIEWQRQLNASIVKIKEEKEARK